MSVLYDGWVEAVKEAGASGKITGEYKDLFNEAHFSPNVFRRLKRVLGYCNPDFFLLHYTSVWYAPYRKDFEKESELQLKAAIAQRYREKKEIGTVPFKLRGMNVLLRRFEAVEPITLPLIRKAKKAGLTAGFDFHPLLGKGDWSFPTLVFRDKAGPVFWTRVETKGKEVTVGFIHSMKCNYEGTRDPNAFARLERAKNAMGYGQVRDGMFRDICRAARGRFSAVHITNPRVYPQDTIMVGVKRPQLFPAFDSFAQRQKLTVTKRRGTRRIGK